MWSQLLRYARLRRAYRYIIYVHILPRRLPWYSFLKSSGSWLCGFLLCLGLSNAAQADDAASAADEIEGRPV